MEAYKAKMEEFKKATKPREVKESNLADGSTGTNQGGSTPQVSSANVKKEQQALKNENDKELKKVEQDIEKSSTNPLK